MPDPKKRLTQDILLSQYKWIAPLSYRHVLYLNPLIFGAFQRFRREDQVAFDGYFLDEAETELGLFWTTDGTDVLKLRPYEGTHTLVILTAGVDSVPSGTKV